MAEKNEREAIDTTPFMARPEVGTALSLMSGLSFLVLAMLLPMVGKAAQKVVHLQQNTMTFSAVLALTTVLSALAVVSKLQRRKLDGSPLPTLSIGMLGLCILIGVALATGLLAI